MIRRHYKLCSSISIVPRVALTEAQEVNIASEGTETQFLKAWGTQDNETFR